MAQRKKRFQTAKFIGKEWSVVDTKANATVGVHPSREAAKAAADKLNELAVAQVGAHDPFSATDQWAATMALVAMVEAGLRPARVVVDVVNLDYGRDFLAEDTRYDIVVVHSVFHCDRPGALEANRQVSLARTSPLHSVEAWRARLASTGAQFVTVVEGAPLSLSGWKLGDLPGYETVARDARVTVYRRRS